MIKCVRLPAGYVTDADKDVDDELLHCFLMGIRQQLCRLDFYRNPND